MDWKLKDFREHLTPYYIWLFIILLFSSVALQLTGGYRTSQLIIEKTGNGALFVLLFFWFILAVLVCFAVNFLRNREGFICSTQRNVTLFDWAVLILFYGLHCSLFLFLFPFRLWNNPVYFGDYPYQYYVTLRNTEMLKGLTFGGWEHTFLGGYPQFLDFSKDLSLLFFPFATLFSSELAFHLLLLTLILLLPVFFYLWLRTYQNSTAISVYGTHLFILYFFLDHRQFYNGMVTRLAGLLLFLIITLLAVKFYRSGRTGYLAGMGLFVFIQVQSHASFYLFTFFFLLLYLLITEQLFSLPKRTVSFFLFLTVPVLPFASHYLLVKPYAIASSKLFEEGALFSLTQSLEQMSKPLLWLDWGIYGVFMMILVFSAGLVKDKRSFPFLLIGIFFFIPSFFKTAEGIGFALSRVDNILFPIFCLLWGASSQRLSIRAYYFLLVLFSLFLLFSTKPFPHTLPHISHEYFDVFFGEMKERRFDNERVLAENAARWKVTNYDNETSIVTLPHYVSYLPQACNCFLLSNPGSDPYHYSTFRMNTVTNGTFYGHPLRLSDEVTFLRFLTDWRVRAILAWSDNFRAFIDSFPQYFEKVLTHDAFHFYSVNEQKTVIPGIVRAEIINHDHDSLTMTIRNCHVGDLVVVDTNYSSLWRPDQTKYRIHLISYNGQIAFRSPIDGNFSVTLKYPMANKWYYFTFALFLLSIFMYHRFMKKGINRELQDNHGKN